MKLLITMVYLSIIVLIGIAASRKVKNSKDFILGGRRFGVITTALGAGASDMSGWLMMGLPGLAYLNGITAIWLPIGLSIGAYLNWKFVARRLRVQTEKYKNSLTIPSYLANRFDDTSGVIGVVTAVMTSIFLIIYIASALVALSLLLSSFTSFDYRQCLYFSAGFVLIYTSIGGFIAINWIDVIQGSLMLFALLLVPIAIIIDQTSLLNAYNTFQTLGVNTDNPFLGLDLVTIISMLGWGLGYFGQPHILVRFMAIKKSEVLKSSMRICMTWMVICLVGALCVGIFSKPLFINLEINPETVFLLAADKLFPEWLAGIVLAAVVSAIMSSISAQLHVVASCITQDLFCQPLDALRYIPNKIWLTRIAMLLVVIISVISALNPQNTVLNLVSFAWAGLGSAFGPVILFSLYSRKMTKNTALYGIIIGGLTVLIWPWLSKFGGMFRVYELIPGFMFATIAIIIKNYKTLPLKTSKYHQTIN